MRIGQGAGLSTDNAPCRRIQGAFRFRAGRNADDGFGDALGRLVDNDDYSAEIRIVPCQSTERRHNQYATDLLDLRPLAESGIEALVATAAAGRRRRHDFRPAKADTPAKEPKAEWLQVMAKKLASEEGRALYKLRQQTAEPVFGIIKAVLGFTVFSLRGLDKVAGEWNLVALAYNCKRLHKLKMAS